MPKKKTLRLCDIPKGSRIYEECSDSSKSFVYDHPDGMYSYCLTEKGNVVHLGQMQPLVPYKDGYKFAEVEKAKEEKDQEKSEEVKRVIQTIT